MSGMSRPLTHEERETADLCKLVDSLQAQLTSWKEEARRANSRADQAESEARAARANAHEVGKLRSRVAQLEQALGQLGMRA